MLPLLLGFYYLVLKKIALSQDKAIAITINNITKFLAGSSLVNISSVVSTLLKDKSLVIVASGNGDPLDTTGGLSAITLLTYRTTIAQFMLRIIKVGIIARLGGVDVARLTQLNLDSFKHQETALHLRLLI